MKPSDHISLARWPFCLRWLTQTRVWRWLSSFATKTRSMTTPWGVVYLRDTAWLAGGLPSPAVRALIAHEAVHLDQMAAHWGWVLSPWFWTVRYLLSPSFRLSQEIEGEAAEAAARAQLLGEPLARRHVSHGLRPGGVYKLPKGTDREAVTQQILDKAREISGEL